jgi:hypothetical protein
MNAAPPCSAHEQNALSFGSGDTSLSSRTSTNSASSRSRLMIFPTRGRRTPSLVRTALYSDRISSVTSQTKVPCSSQVRRNDALGCSTVRPDLNPATPATSTDVSTTPLGCFSRRPNGYLRQLLLLGTEAANGFCNLGFGHARQIIRRRFQSARELALPSGPFSAAR